MARRALALRCPRCGGTELFSGWFTMRPACALCGLRFGLSTPAQFVIWIPFLLVFPLWFFRYSRSLWLALELYLNPEE